MPEAFLPLLRLMSDGDFHSAAELARTLGAPHTATVKGLRELAALGLQIDTRRGRGYRLATPFECLDQALLRRALGAYAAHFDIALLERCDSTNTLLLEQARCGAVSGRMIACELQSAGRGRRGNHWHSGLGDGLTFSLLWRFEQGTASLSGLSLAAGVAAVRALDGLGVTGVQLKWPNDLLHAGRKLGGVLVELQGDVHGPSAAVIGIGLNLLLSAAVRDGIAQAVTDVASISAETPSRNRLLAAVLIELDGVLAQFAQQGFAAVREEWLSHHAHQGRPVRLALGNGKEVTGQASGVADDGALLLDTGHGIERFHSGEISLRPG